MSQLPEIPYATPPQKDNSWMAITSFVLGLVGLMSWCIPLCGFPLAIGGIILGVMGLKTRHRTLAIIGIILCSLSLFGTLVNAAIGAYLGATGQHGLINRFK